MLEHEYLAKKTQDIKGEFNKIWLSSEYLEAHLNISGINRIKNKFSWCKKFGVSFGDLISTFLILPIIGVHSI